MVPAQQRLKACNHLPLEVEDRLEMKLELTPFDGDREVTLETATILHRLVHRGLEEPVAAAPFLLGRIERQISILEQLVDAPAVGGQRDTDREADGTGLPIDRERAPRRFEKFHREDVCVVGARADIHHDGKLVAPHAGSDTAATQRGLEAIRDFLEQLVAAHMAKCVVDRFEPVEVDEQQGEAVPAVGARDAIGEALMQHMPIGETGKLVVMSAKPELVLQAGDFGDVLVRRHPAAIAERLVGH